MNRAEALEFIGLTEPVNREAVLSKYTERYNYFQMLLDNAPNKVIQRIQQHNLDKLKLVKQVLIEEGERKKAVTNRFFISVGKETEGPSLDSSDKPVLGWLIVHTEYRKADTYELYEGVNYIGRKKKNDSGHSIIIEGDPFISRTHAFIKCRLEGDRYEFILYDGDGSRPSINGVFLNGRDERLKSHCYLRENDTLQVGSTKLVFKVNKDNTTVSNEVKDVLNTEYIRTVDIRK